MDTTLDLRQTLTEKEKCIYELLCKNLCNKEIAEIIGLTTDGVVYYLRIIYRKLGVHSANKIAMRQMAISYAGTRVLETVTVKNGKPSYTMTEIYAAMHKLTQYDSQRRQEILEDLFSVLESKKVEC